MNGFLSPTADAAQVQLAARLEATSVPPMLPHPNGSNDNKIGRNNIRRDSRQDMWFVSQELLPLSSSVTSSRAPSHVGSVLGESVTSACPPTNLLAIAQGQILQVSRQGQLARAEGTQGSKSVLLETLEALASRQYPLSCATSVDLTDCRQDGTPPNMRVSRAARNPCLVLSLNGGNHVRAASSTCVEKVVCTVSLGSQSFQTLAAPLGAQGIWNECTVCVFALDINQLQLLSSPLVEDGDKQDTQDTHDMQDQKGKQQARIRRERKRRNCVLAISCALVQPSGNKCVIGRVNLDLKALLHLATNPPSHTKSDTVAHLLDASSNPVCCPDAQGRMQKASIYFNVAEFGLSAWVPAATATSTLTWAPLSLDDFLQTVNEPHGTSTQAPPPCHALSHTPFHTPSHCQFANDELDNDAGGEERHWRERLEQVTDSLWINAAVIILVLIDMVLAIAFHFSAKQDAVTPPAVLVIQSFILAGFVFELLLRYVAKQERFWRSLWNIFDLLVILSSVIIFLVIVAYGSGGEELSGAKTSTTSLRLASRFATALRIMRIMLTLRKAHHLDIKSEMRGIVSQNKRRFKCCGFDLDLTYITDRVIAMSVPAFGGHSAYRNDIHVVSRFFVERHYSHFLIFNLCDTYISSDGVLGNYASDVFCRQCQRIPFEDHGPPLLVEMFHFCTQAARWNNLHDQNVIAVHCKGGKGRTGVMIAAFLLWTGHRRCAMDALELFSFRRTQNWDPSLGFNDDEDSDDMQKTTKSNQGYTYIHV